MQSYKDDLDLWTNHAQGMNSDGSLKYNSSVREGVLPNTVTSNHGSAMRFIDGGLLFFSFLFVFEKTETTCDVEAGIVVAHTCHFHARSLSSRLVFDCSALDIWV